MRPRTLAPLLAPLLGELTRFARWLAPAPHDADEVVQETLVRALAAAGDVRDTSALRAWLFRIARNAHVDMCRRRAAHDRFVVLDGGIEDHADLAAARPPPIIERADLERALLALPEASRTVLLLTDLWELDHAEVAAILDVPVGTVKSRAARARARVAALLGARSVRRGAS